VSNEGDAPDAGTVFVGPDAAAARLDALLAGPGAAEQVAAIRARMAAADDAAAEDVNDATEPRTGGERVTRKTYTYNVSRDGKFWLINVPELDAMTQARYLGEIELMTRDLISIWIEQPTESFDVEGTMTLPSGAGARLAAAVRLAREADLEAGRAAQQLRDAQVGIRDIGRILGCSYVRARKLLANADGQDSSPDGRR